MPTESKSPGAWNRARSKFKSTLRATASAIGVAGSGKTPTEYAYGDVSITLPGDHALPEYQRAHRLYDRFLPHLVQYLPAGSAVVDVGANCGDTVAAMYAKNPKLSYVCIEPDQAFFDLMVRNVQRIVAKDAEASIRCVQSLVGKAVSSAVLEGGAGTKKAKLGDAPDAISSVTLDSLFTSSEPGKVTLIKSDVDGYDYDVLDSAALLISQDKPLLFFECQMDNQSQRDAFDNTISGLVDQGYHYWALFDNFGELVFQARELGDVRQLFDYVWRQNKGRSTRTIWYFDVLAAHESAADVANAAVGDYLQL